MSALLWIAGGVLMLVGFGFAAVSGEPDMDARSSRFSRGLGAVLLILGALLWRVA